MHEEWLDSLTSASNTSVAQNSAKRCARFFIAVTISFIEPNKV